MGFKDTSYSVFGKFKEEKKMKGKRINGIFVCAIFLSFALVTISSVKAPLLPLNGYVKESGTSNPISDATVKLWIYDFNTGWIYIGERTTDTNGYYSFSSVPIGARKIQVSKAGYKTYEGAYQSIIYLEIYTYDYIFYGTIRDSVTLQALSNAVAKVTCGTKTITDTTDNSGYYCIVFSYSTGGARTFNMEVSKSGYSTYTATITRNPGYEHRDINLKQIRSWLYIEDYGSEDTYLRFEITEYVLSTQYKLVFDVTIEFYYYLNPGFDIQVQRYCPIGHLWISNWITNDDATDTELPGGLHQVYAHVVDEFYYDKTTYYSSWCGVFGGLVRAPTYLFPFYGMELVFQIDNPTYGTPFDWEEDWFGSYPYGFFGTLDEGFPNLTVNYPSGAWYSRA